MQVRKKENGLERVKECIRQLREGRGPYYDRWLRGITEGVNRKRAGGVDSSAPSPGRRKETGKDG